MRVKLATTIGVVVTAATLVWAVVEYIAQREAERAGHTIDYIDMWENKGYQQQYYLLSDEWSGFLKRIPESDRLAFKENIGDRIIYKRNILNRFYREIELIDANVNAVKDLVYFFNRMSLCIEADVCSGKVAKTFFGEIVESTFDVFGEYIINNDEELPGDSETLQYLFNAISN